MTWNGLTTALTDVLIMSLSPVMSWWLWLCPPLCQDDCLTLLPFMPWWPCNFVPFMSWWLSYLVTSYVKLYLLPDHSKDTKWKTHTVHKSVNPEYNETFTVSYILIIYLLARTHFTQYDGRTKSMESRTLQVSMWSQDRFVHNKFLGDVRFNPKETSLTDTIPYWYHYKKWWMKYNPLSFLYHFFKLNSLSV